MSYTINNNNVFVGAFIRRWLQIIDWARPTLSFRGLPDVGNSLLLSPLLLLFSGVDVDPRHFRPIANPRYVIG